MDYGFYGWNYGDASTVTDEYDGICTPRDLYDALSDIWCEYTCAPRLREGGAGRTGPWGSALSRHF